MPTRSCREQAFCQQNDLRPIIGRIADVVTKLRLWQDSHDDCRVQKHSSSPYKQQELTTWLPVTDVGGGDLTGRVLIIEERASGRRSVSDPAASGRVTEQ
jgi:hypothetical protein